jgi:hypothetical protein
LLRSITAAQVVEAVRVRAASAAESLKVFTKSFRSPGAGALPASHIPPR